MNVDAALSTDLPRTPGAQKISGLVHFGFGEVCYEFTFEGENVFTLGTHTTQQKVLVTMKITNQQEHLGYMLSEVVLGT